VSILITICFFQEGTHLNLLKSVVEINSWNIRNISNLRANQTILLGRRLESYLINLICKTLNSTVQMIILILKSDIFFRNNLISLGG